MADLQIEQTKQRNASGRGGVVLQEEAEILDRHDGRIILFQLSGPVSFGSAKGMMQGLAFGSGNKVIILDFSEVTLVDTTGAFAIEDLLHRAVVGNQTVFIAGLKEQARKVLSGLEVLASLPKENLFAERLQAIRQADATLAETIPEGGSATECPQIG